MSNPYDVTELIYSAGQRCLCGAGVAYPLDHTEARQIQAWVCSRLLTGDASLPYDSRPRAPRDGIGPAISTDTSGQEHSAYPWWCYEGLSEAQPSAEGRTTRPPGSHLETVPHCTCRACGHTWEAVQRLPYGPHHHLVSGLDCPRCGETYEGVRTDERHGVDTRWRYVVVRDEEVTP